MIGQEIGRKSETRRYLLRIAVAMALYLASLALAEWLVEERGLAGISAYVLVAIPGLCIASLFWITARLIVEERDEFVRMLHVRQTLLATGIALTAAAVWGFFEQYGLAAHIEAYWWPTIWCFGTGIGAVYNGAVYGLWSREQ